MKHLFILLTRLLIRNDTQDNNNPDNFTFYLNSLVSLCYDSANIGYETFNHNLKSIVLSIVQTIMTDLNSVSANIGIQQQQHQRGKHRLLKRKLEDS